MPSASRPCSLIMKQAGACSPSVPSTSMNTSTIIHVGSIEMAVMISSLTPCPHCCTFASQGPMAGGLRRILRPFLKAVHPDVLHEVSPKERVVSLG